MLSISPAEDSGKGRTVFFGGDHDLLLPWVRCVLPLCSWLPTECFFRNRQAFSRATASLTDGVRVR